ncbi:Tat pathway signal protein [Halorubraceae archaeon YAN]|nr:Tat pathway signal protein [Halorubraceae archaeon YAN]
MNRRLFLSTLGAGAVGSLAGCTDPLSVLGETTYGREPPLVSDRPDAIYYPTHTEGMNMSGMGMADNGLHVHLMYTFPHRFWRIFSADDGGYEARKFDVGRDDAVHLMVGVWDHETELPIPVSGVNIGITGGNDVNERETVYPMLSQRMGFHYGDNYHLDGDGEYTAEVTVEGIVGEAYGDFEGRFDQAQTVSIDFEYDEAERNDLPFEEYPDRQGEQAAVEPMHMDHMPLGFAESLPGESLGEGREDDIRYKAAVVDADRFGSDPYLAVTAETRYNELLIPQLGLDATVTTDGNDETVPLSPAIDPELGFHYGTPVAELTADSEVAVTVTTPAQIARHEGYETAFFDTPTVSLS